MSIRFFSGESGGREAPRGQFAPRESQQALLLRLLREANGETVTYDRLRASGIDLPASVVSELELSGFPIERRYEHVRGSARRPGVRLNPALDPERASLEEPGTDGIRPPAQRRGRPDRQKSGVPRQIATPLAGGLAALSENRLTSPLGIRVRLPSRARLAELRPARRVLAPLAVIGAMVVVIAVVAIALQGSHARSRHVVRHHPSKLQARSTGGVAPAPQASAPHQPATAVSPALATEFEDQGHDLLESGRYSSAVPVLRRAIAATGMHPGDCVEPASETCLTYAYALYDLGRALELNGDPSAALPVLEQRLQIDNQRDVVQDELARVRTGVQQ